MGKKDPRVDNYIAKSAPFAQPILNHLRELVHRGCPETEETMKWSMPSFVFKGILCMMAAFKQHATFGFWKGKLIVGENGEQLGMGQFGRLTSLQDLPSDKTLLRYIRKAAELNAAGVKAPRERAKPSEKRQIGVPDFLATALSQNKQAKGNFEKFSYSHKKEYIQWLVEAKREETRQKRLQTALAWIAQGKPQNWKYMRAKSLLPALFGLFLCSAAHAADSSAEKFWPQWRGPLCTGVAPHADPPLTWSETNHVKWKLPIPGEGDSTPIVWGSRVFILSAVPVGEDAAASAGKEKGLGPFRFTVICVDRSEGKVVWQKVARETAPHEGRQENNTFASASPVTDGQLLWAFFGSRGLHCYDFDGNLKWEKDFGQMKTKMGFGEGASPALSGDTLIINWDHEGDDFIAALDKTTGKELWRQPRNEGTGWSTPLIVDYHGQKQVVVNATGKVRSYDLATGKELWSCAGQTANAIPSPVAQGDFVYLTSGFRGNALQAIRLGRTGDLTGTDAIAWRHDKSTPYVPSPLLAGDFLYLISGNDAMLSCFNAKTGEPYFERERLEGLRGVYASPVSAGDRVYVLGRDGVCAVLKKGAKPEVLALNKLADNRSDASIALVENQLFVRTAHNLYCISETP